MRRQDAGDLDLQRGQVHDSPIVIKEKKTRGRDPLKMREGGALVLERRNPRGGSTRPPGPGCCQVPLVYRLLAADFSSQGRPFNSADNSGKGDAMNAISGKQRG